MSRQPASLSVLKSVRRCLTCVSIVICVLFVCFLMVALHDVVTLDVIDLIFRILVMVILGCLYVNTKRIMRMVERQIQERRADGGFSDYKGDLT